MCFWILTENGKVVSRSSVQALTKEELNDTNIKSIIHRYDLSVDHHIGDNNVSVRLNLPKNATYIQVEDDIMNTPYEPVIEPPEEDDVPMNTYDQLINAEVLLPDGDTLKLGTVTGYKRNSYGNLLG
jgi:hypothetical protein